MFDCSEAFVCGQIVHLFVSPRTHVWHRRWQQTLRGFQCRYRHPGLFYLWTRACCGTWHSCRSVSAPHLSASPAVKIRVRVHVTWWFFQYRHAYKGPKTQLPKSSVIHKNPQRNTYYTLCYIMDLHCGKCGQFWEYIDFFSMSNDMEKAVFRPKALVTVAELLEIDRSTTQSLWGLPDTHLPEPIHISHFPSFSLCTALIRTHWLTASRQKADLYAKCRHCLRGLYVPKLFHHLFVTYQGH